VVFGGGGKLVLADWWDNWRCNRMARKARWHLLQADRLQRDIRRSRLVPTVGVIVFTIVYWLLAIPLTVFLVHGLARWLGLIP
jgi:hypothetical protein